MHIKFNRGSLPISTIFGTSSRQYPVGFFEITELNENVIFEFGMATGLNLTNFLFVYKDSIPDKYKKEEFPPFPLRGIEYISYMLNPSMINKKIEDKVKPVINALKDSDKTKCRIIDSHCIDNEQVFNKREMFVAFPEKNKEFFDQVYSVIKKVTKPYKYKINRHSPAKSLNQLCLICNNVRNSSICIIDTTYNDLSMLFALGVAFGKDKKFIQLHDTELAKVRPISDISSWTIEYKNIEELENRLKEEFNRRFK